MTKKREGGMEGVVPLHPAFQSLILMIISLFLIQSSDFDRYSCDLELFISNHLVENVPIQYFKNPAYFLPNLVQPILSPA